VPFDVKSVKKLFFDTAAVSSALSAGERRALSKFGAFVRRRAKSSLRYKKGSAKPGAPPNVHRSEGWARKIKNKKTGTVTRRPSSPLRELLFFAYDPARKSVVIGPALGGPRTDAPRRLEEGRGVKPHPFMGPAFKAELPKAPSMFKNAIR